MVHFCDAAIFECSYTFESPSSITFISKMKKYQTIPTYERVLQTRHHRFAPCAGQPPLRVKLWARESVGGDCAHYLLACFQVRRPRSYQSVEGHLWADIPWIRCADEIPDFSSSEGCFYNKYVILCVLFWINYIYVYIYIYIYTYIYMAVSIL